MKRATKVVEEANRKADKNRRKMMREFDDLVNITYFSLTIVFLSLKAIFLGWRA